MGSPCSSSAGRKVCDFAHSSAASPKPKPGSETIETDFGVPSGATTARSTTTCSSTDRSRASRGQSQSQSLWSRPTPRPPPSPLPADSPATPLPSPRFVPSPGASPAPEGAVTPPGERIGIAGGHVGIGEIRHLGILFGSGHFGRLGRSVRLRRLLGFGSRRLRRRFVVRWLGLRLFGLRRIRFCALRLRLRRTLGRWFGPWFGFRVDRLLGWFLRFRLGRFLRRRFQVDRMEFGRLGRLHCRGGLRVSRKPPRQQEESTVQEECTEYRSCTEHPARLRTVEDEDHRRILRRLRGIVDAFLRPSPLFERRSIRAQNPVRHGPLRNVRLFSHDGPLTPIPRRLHSTPRRRRLPHPARAKWRMRPAPNPPSEVRPSPA